MSAQYRPYRDDDSLENDHVNWADQEPGSIQIYEKTTEDIRVVSSRNLVVGGFGIGFLGGLVGLLIGYFAHSQHAECVPGLSVAIHSVRDEDVTVRPLLLNMVDSERIKNNTRLFTTQGADLPEIIKNQWHEYGLDNVRIHEYQALLSYPDRKRPNRVEMIKENESRQTCDLSFTLRDQPYVAYSISKKVIAQLVYVNYLSNQDVNILHQRNVTLEGKILLARLGIYPVAQQIEQATNLGASGLLLYPDPAEFHPMSVSEINKKWWLPSDGVPTVSARWDSFGDPLTPGYPSTDQGYRKPIDEVITKIPVQTISADCAHVFLQELGGTKAERIMYGGFNDIEYYFGPSNYSVDLQVYNTNVLKPVKNVIGSIRGKVEPDRYVIVGSSFDSWGEFQLGGVAILQELSHVFGKLLKEGWRPRRSVIFCGWSGEEFNSIGSTEWLEEHMKLLHGRAVAYVSVGLPVLGGTALNVAASPLLYHAVFNATKQVPEPSYQENEHDFHKTVYDKWLKTFPMNRNSSSRLLFPENATGDIASLDYDFFFVDPPHSGPAKHGLLNNYMHSAMMKVRPAVRPLDLTGGYAAFFTRAGIPAVYVNFVSDILQKKSAVQYPKYHSQYDKFAYVQNELDPSFKYHKAITQVLAELLRDLADSLFLPFNLLDYAQVLQDLAFSLRINIDDIGGQKNDIKTEILDSAVKNFSNAAYAFHLKQDKLDTSDPMAIRKINDQLLLLERAFLDPKGLPRNSDKKHIVLSPGELVSYMDETFPGIMDEFIRLFNNFMQPHDLSKSMESMKQHFHILVQTIQSAADTLNELVC